MTDKNAIDRIIEKAKESIVPSGDLLEILRDLQAQMRLMNKMYAGGMGSRDMNRLADVQFQTYPKYHEWPDRLIVGSFNSAAPQPVQFVPVGIMRVAAVSLTLQPTAAAGAIALVSTLFSGGAMEIAYLHATPTSPYVYCRLPEPYPTVAGQHQPNPGQVFERFAVRVQCLVVNPADQASGYLYYFDHVDNPVGA
jgi:hypothetical protein